MGALMSIEGAYWMFSYLYCYRESWNVNTRSMMTITHTWRERLPSHLRVPDCVDRALEFLTVNNYV